MVKKQEFKKELLEQLVANGHEYARIDGTQLEGTQVRDEDVKTFFSGLPLDKVCLLLCFTVLVGSYSELSYRLSKTDVTGSSVLKPPMQRSEPKWS